MAATSMNPAGKLAARAIATVLYSGGWRMTSSRSRGNLGSSSKEEDTVISE